MRTRSVKTRKAGSAPSAPVTIKGFANIFNPSRYMSNLPLINLFTQDFGTWSDSSGNTSAVGTRVTGSDGWIYGLAPGEAVYKFPIIDARPPAATIRQGTYYATWTGPATVTFVANANVATNARTVSANKVAIDISGQLDPVLGTAFQLTVKVENTTGSSFDFTAANNLRVYHADDEADLLAGKLIQQSFKYALGNTQCVRMMDWMATNNAFATKNGINTGYLAGYYANPTAVVANNRLEISTASFTSSVVGKYLWVTAGTNRGRMGVVTSRISSTVIEFEDIENPGSGFPSALQLTDSVNVTDALVRSSDWPTESYAQWIDPMPASVIGKFGTEAQVDLWVNIPICAQDSLIQYLADEIYTNYPSGKLYVEAGNEVWNFAGGYLDEYNWAKAMGSRLTARDTNGNVSTNENDRAAAAQAELSLRAWKIFETKFGRSRIVRILGGWAASPSTFAGGFEYVDVNGHVSLNAKMKNIIDAWAFAPYVPMRESGLTTPTLENDMLSKNYLQPASFLDTRYRYGLDQVAVWLDAVEVLRMQKKPGLRLICYEGGLDSQDSGNGALSCTIDSGTNTLQGASISSMFDDGDEMQYGGGSSALFSGSFNWQRYRVRVVSGGLRVYATQADYNSNTPATLTGSGTYTATNLTRKEAWQDYKDSYRTGTAVATLHQDYIDDLKIRGFECFNQFYLVGGYRGNQWGLIRDQYAADTSLLSWWRSAFSKQWPST